MSRSAFSVENGTAAALHTLPCWPRSSSGCRVPHAITHASFLQRRCLRRHPDRAMRKKARCHHSRGRPGFAWSSGSHGERSRPTSRISTRRSCRDRRPAGSAQGRRSREVLKYPPAPIPVDELAARYHTETVTVTQRLACTISGQPRACGPTTKRFDRTGLTSSAKKTAASRHVADRLLHIARGTRGSLSWGSRAHHIRRIYSTFAKDASPRALRGVASDNASPARPCRAR